MAGFRKDIQYYKFCAYGFLKNLRFFEPFLILFFREGNLSYLQIGVIYTIREIIRNIFEIPSGLAADVLGRRRTMITSFSLYMISFLIYSMGYRYGMLIAATIVFALGDAFRTGTHKAMIFDYLDRREWTSHKVSYYGHTRSWSQAGSALSALMAAALIFYTGRISQVFIYSIIPYAFGLLLIISYPAYLDGEAPGFRQSSLKTAFTTTLGNFWYSFKQARVLRGILNLSVYSGYYRAVKDYVQPLIQSAALSLPVLVSLQSEQKTAALVGIIYFLIYLLSSAVTRQAGPFSNWFQGLSGPLNLTLLAGLIIGTLTGFFSMAGFTMLSILLFIGIYLVENLRLPTGIAYFTENLDKDILATTLSAESQSKSLFTAVIALLIGFLADRFDIGTAILACSAFMLLTTPLYLIRKRG
ncbi:MAG: hypothetical protein AMS26_21540 [Bacteroides sp. SM23_62]|nr:MAG: hypothetical protein AMS26_21540 [Bacteroides sp. SM23_62]